MVWKILKKEILNFLNKSPFRSIAFTNWAANEPSKETGETFMVASTKDAKWTDQKSDFSAEVFCQLPVRTAKTCSGDQTYTVIDDRSDLELTGKFTGEFLKGFDAGTIITRVVKVKQITETYTDYFQGRGSDKYTYGSYGTEKFHNEGDKIRLECKRGFVNTVGKRLMQAECKCKDDTCAWTKKKAAWGCAAEQVVF